MVLNSCKMLGNVGGDDGDMHADILNVAVAVIVLVVATVVLMVLTSIAASAPELQAL